MTRNRGSGTFFASDHLVEVGENGRTSWTLSRDGRQDLARPSGSRKEVLRARATGCPQISFESGFGAYQSLAQKIKVPFSKVFSFVLQFSDNPKPDFKKGQEKHPKRGFGNIAILKRAIGSLHVSPYLEVGGQMTIGSRDRILKGGLQQDWPTKWKNVSSSSAHSNPSTLSVLSSS